MESSHFVGLKAKEWSGMTYYLFICKKYFLWTDKYDLII